MHFNWRPSSTAALLASVLLVGCSISTPVRYVPEAGHPAAGAPAISIRTQIVRPEDQGGQTPRIGFMRDGGGLIPLAEDSASDIERVAREVTTDALAQSGIAVEDDGPLILDVKVNNYWLDGFQQFYANVEFACELRETGGKVVWSRIVNGSGGDSVSRRPYMEAPDIVVVAFGIALRQAADAAADAFREEEFVRLVQEATGVAPVAREAPDAVGKGALPGPAPSL